jgi:hypothetical protein
LIRVLHTFAGSQEFEEVRRVVGFVHQELARTVGQDVTLSLIVKLTQRSSYTSFGRVRGCVGFRDQGVVSVLPGERQAGL